MSAVDSRLGMSLDSIISAKPRPTKKSGNGKPSAGGRKKVEKVVRSAGNTNNRVGKVQRQPEQKFNKQVRNVQPQAQQNAAVSVFDRLGKLNSNEPTGTKVLISNLHGAITSADIAELCGSIGETKRVDISARKNGVVAEVIFARQSDASNCVNKLNGLALDNRAMAVKLANGPGVAAPVNNNVRVGLFGTANQNQGGNNSNNNNGTTFSVTLGNNGNRQVQNKQQQQRVVIQQPFGGQQQQQRNGGGQQQQRNASQGRQQRGNGKVIVKGGRGAGAGARKATTATTAMDLDAELDAWHNKDAAPAPTAGAGARKGRGGARAPTAAAVTTADLDAEMDAYRSNA